MTLRTLKVCYFPGRESSYVRNRVLINGMRNAGLKVYDCSYHKKNKTTLPHWIRQIFMFEAQMRCCLYWIFRAISSTHCQIVYKKKNLI